MGATVKRRPEDVLAQQPRSSGEQGMRVLDGVIGRAGLERSARLLSTFPLAT